MYDIRYTIYDILYTMHYILYTRDGWLARLPHCPAAWLSTCYHVPV